jgi:hypothetical protein
MTKLFAVAAMFASLGSCAVAEEVAAECPEGQAKNAEGVCAAVEAAPEAPKA